jgi:hypothetical protein
MPGWNATLNGEVDDFTTVPVTDLTMRLTGADLSTVLLPGGGSLDIDHDFSGELVTDKIPVGDPTYPYGSGDHPHSLNPYGSAVPVAQMVYGPTVVGFSLNRSSSLTLEPFIRLGGAYGWAGTDTDSLTYVTDRLVVVGSATGSPQVEKTLYNDIDQMLGTDADIAAWWADRLAYMSSNDALFWSGSGGDATHIGEWWKLGKALVPNPPGGTVDPSDHWNWSSWRYVKVRLKASIACTLTLTVDHYEAEIYYPPSPPNPPPPHASIAKYPQTTEFALEVGTDLTEIILDLSKAGSWGFRYLTKLTVTGIPNGETIEFYDIKPHEAERPKADLHHPLWPILSVYERGKPCLFLGRGIDNAPSSSWGYPGQKNTRCETVEEFCRSINMQEGFEATDLSPDLGHSTPAFTAFIKDVVGGALPHSFDVRRSFGTINHPLDYKEEKVYFYVQVGGSVKPMVWNAALTAPVTAKVSLEQNHSPNAVIKTGRCASYGSTTLLIVRGDTSRLYASKGETEESHVDKTTNARTIWFQFLTGIGEPGGFTGLVRDRLGNEWATIRRDPDVYLVRRLGSNVLWEYRAIDEGDHPSVAFDDDANVALLAYEKSDGHVYVAEIGQIGTGTPTITDMASGTFPVANVPDDHSGLRYLTYWVGNETKLRIYDPLGGEWSGEITVVVSLDEQPVYVVKRENGQMELAYSDGSGDVQIRVSDDGGFTWSDA